jgi:hypothetical protein
MGKQLYELVFRRSVRVCGKAIASSRQAVARRRVSAPAPNDIASVLCARALQFRRILIAFS